MRLFVAAYPPPAARDHLAAVLPTLAVGQPAAPGRSLRLVAPELWHLTLAFLGEVPDDRQGVTEQAVAAAVADHAVADHAAADHAAAGPAAGAPGAGGQPPAAAPLTLRIAGGGRFGRGRFTVVWAGVEGDVGGLRALAATIRRRLRRARLPCDPKPLRPHLTIARPGDRLPRETVDADVGRLAGYEGPPWTVGEVCLVRSRLGPNPVHATIGAWRLA